MSDNDKAGGRDLEQANADPVSKAIHSKNPNMPRQIRAKQGMTDDPVPDGKEVDAAPTRHFNIIGQDHGGGSYAEEQMTVGMEKKIKEDKVREIQGMHDAKPPRLSNKQMQHREPGLDPRTGGASHANVMTQRKT